MYNAAETDEERAEIDSLRAEFDPETDLFDYYYSVQGSTLEMRMGIGSSEEDDFGAEIASLFDLPDGVQVDSIAAVATYTRLVGAMPPAGWPTTICSVMIGGYETGEYDISVSTTGLSKTVAAQRPVRRPKLKGLHRPPLPGLMR